jgi:hypothetical protein
VFNKPDEKQIARMTPESIAALIGALRAKRQDLVESLDEEISYYLELHTQKVKERTDVQTGR